MTTVCRYITRKMSVLYNLIPVIVSIIQQLANRFHKQSQPVTGPELQGKKKDEEELSDYNKL